MLVNSRFAILNAMRRLFGAVLTSILLLGLSVYPVNAAVKPGSPCKKQGQESKSPSMTYTCIKKNNRLVWNKGVKPKTTEQGITVDKNLLSVDVTVPASFYEGEKITQEKLNDEAAKKGYGKATLNPNGSVTFRMSKSQHNKALADMKKSVDDYIQETVNDSPKIFKEISYNKSMTEFNVVVDKKNFEDDFAAGMIGLGIGIMSSFYQMFNGVKDEPKTTIKLTDVATGKVFDTTTWPIKE